MNKEVSPLSMLRRIRGNVTQAQLGEAIGVTANTVYRWEKGDVKPRLEVWQVKKLCKFLGIRVEQLPDDFGPQPIPESLSELTSELTTV
jgi:DNA-binding XRE family transcriptional regulator